MENMEQKVDILIEAIPYIKEFVGEIVVIKYGGNAMIDEDQKKNVIKQIALLKMLNIKIVLVHGGGPDIENELKEKNIKSQFKNGLRVTDKETMNVVEMILIGKTNTKLVKMLNEQSCNAIGLSGIDASIIKCNKSNKDIGYVGEIETVNRDLIIDLLDKGYTPVISPIGVDANGNTYNINADIAACEIAIGLKAKKILLLSNIDGIIDKNKKIMSIIKKEKIQELIDNETIKDGMIPKVQACVKCIDKGVERTHILNGTKKNSIIYELLSDKGIGTMIV